MKMSRVCGFQIAEIQGVECVQAEFGESGKQKAVIKKMYKKEKKLKIAIAL